ncbi:retrovirus-related pol polyprotein from transposon TNT 1-94 [Tanacetum coccineum]
MVIEEPEYGIFFIDVFGDQAFQRWNDIHKGLRNANHTQTLNLADIYGRFVYEDNLIQRRYSDTKKALISTPSSTPISTTFFSSNVIQDFQENFDDEVDERSSEEYLRDLDIEYHERALLANSKLNNYSSVSKGFQPKFTPKLIQSSPNSSSQTDQKFQKDYKAEYKKMKAKLALLEASPSSQVLDALVLMDELIVGKSHARNGSFTKLRESSEKNVSRTITINETKPTTPSVPTYKFKNTENTESKLNEVTKLVQMLIDEKVNSTQKIQESNSLSHQTGSSKNHELESYCDEKGISQNFSSPYIPDQNGVAERKNRTLIEAARTMLNGLVLSKHFWTDAVKYPAILKIDQSLSKDMIRLPMKYSGKEFLISATFMCLDVLCLFITHRDPYGKFDAKADDGYCLGYSSVSKAFIFFNTRRQQIEETYHVTCDESMEAIRFTNTSVDEIRIDDSSSLLLLSFFMRLTQSMTISVDFRDVSYYTFLMDVHSMNYLRKSHP